MMSVYGYNSALRVRAGQGVAQGDVIAEVGENGASDRPALYFEIRRGAVAVDPLSYLRSR
jgi:septal ring factor EnvC (AmiA/AmiB activator)